MLDDISVDYTSDIEPILFYDAPIPQPEEDFKEWCRQEYARHEGNRYEEVEYIKSPHRLALLVHSAWADYCRGKSLI